MSEEITSETVAEELPIKERDDSPDFVKLIQEQCRKALKQGASEDDFDNLVDEALIELDKTSARMGINLEQVQEMCAREQILLNECGPENFPDYVIWITGYTNYYIEQEKNLKGLVGIWESVGSILQTYATLLAPGSNSTERKSNSLLFIAGFNTQKERIKRLATQVEGKREAYQDKYKGLSRILAYWGWDSSLDPARVVRKK